MVAQTQLRLAGVRGEVPLGRRHAEVAGQHLLDIGIADATRPCQVARVAGHRRQADQHLQEVAVQFAVGCRKPTPPGLDGRPVHRVGDHVGHAIEPRRTAEQLGHGDQAVLGVFAGAEQAGRAQRAGGEVAVARHRAVDGRVAHLVAQHLHHPAVVERRIGEARREDQVRVEVGGEVVRCGDACRAVDAVRHQCGSRVGVAQPGLQRPFRGRDGAGIRRAVGLGCLGDRRDREQNDDCCERPQSPVQHVVPTIER